MVETQTLQPGVEMRQLCSDLLSQHLQLYIKLPMTYESSDATYPVLYVTDANRSFPLYSTPSLVFETPGFGADEIIIVGVGYRTDPDRLKALVQWAAWRTRDLTPVRREEAEQGWARNLSAMLNGERVVVETGGARRFLRCLLEEVIPFVETSYRVSRTDRGLAGYSYGGLFTLMALFDAPQSFTRYYSGSPSLWDAVFDAEEAYAATHTDLPARLFITATSREAELLERLDRLVQRLRGRSYPGLDLSLSVLEGENHVTGMPAAACRALVALYYAKITQM